MHDRRIFNEQLKKVLASLTSEQRAAYTLRYEEELSVREIAQILHCPEGTVKSRLYYTLKILQRSLSNYNPKTTENENDDLERLEKSQDVQQLIHFAKEQYEQENRSILRLIFFFNASCSEESKEEDETEGFSLVADSCLSAGMDHRIWLPGWK